MNTEVNTDNVALTQKSNNKNKGNKYKFKQTKNSTKKDHQ